jgi:hypothetical protein
MSSVNSFPQSLAEVVTLAMRRHQVDSGRALAAKSRSMGIPITYTVLNQLHAGEYRRRMSPETRDRLAKLSGVRRVVIDRLAGAPMRTPFRLPEDQAATLSGDQRDAVLAVVRAFAAANARAGHMDVDDAVIDEAAYEPGYPMDADVPDKERGDWS